MTFVAPALVLLAAALADDVLVFHLRPALSGEPDALLVLALLGVGAVGAGRAVRTALRRLRAQRRFVRSLVARGQAEVAGVPVVLLADPRPLVFCAGLRRPRIYLSDGARHRLGERALAAVLAHEAHHARRRDPLRLLVAGALGHLPWCAGLARRQGTLSAGRTRNRAPRCRRGRRTRRRCPGHRTPSRHRC